MTYKDDIIRICKEQTTLDEFDIEWILSQADRLMRSSMYALEDVFIDVKDAYSENAIVIFHKKPQKKQSLYEKNVVGSIAYLHNEPGVIRTLQTGAKTNGLSALSQEGVSIQQKVFPITRESKVIAVIIIETDVTEKILSTFSIDNDKNSVYELTNALQVSQLEQITLSDYIDDAILIFDGQGYLKYYNHAANNYYRKKLGYRDSITGMHYDNLVLDSFQFKAIQKKILNGRWENNKIVEIKYGQYYFSVKRHFIQDSNIFVMIFKDITEIKQKESRLLTEATVIREIHHRVKNNLQTVVSLLRLQARRSKNPEVKKTLNDSVNRVLSIAMTHELLSSQTEDEIVLAKVLEETLGNIQRFFMGQSDVRLTYNIDTSILLDSNRAVATALVVNELVQNSYDHAFEKINRKNLYIHLHVSLENGMIRLEVADNGKGYKIQEHEESRLGLTIVNQFVKSKLSGKISVQSDRNGTVTTITFKK
ncbi:histidine kinase [Granulicatella sp. zg-ZJ]|uniref:sensor histidine kinase n=1 Tax=unclassified Granulicatella TaxID=2630493 RepID=UPI0013C1A554|nr:MULTISPECIES: sensor histidine kinase [unclassified Granulicatella]MBS4750700.1 histidine kinase N-terminal domain-containing protein [Carnobacteriaceae bacterium zg-ZUI78]NEW61873.1 histidine kinase [Granulicatella sp. zg-ZJ]NEW65947.1 histidine kinase [Granulicatella sp. zg-84]QMI85172.1 sensor histidine kinase [Carnobacteriaceae bacterium zg-84]